MLMLLVLIGSLEDDGIRFFLINHNTILGVEDHRSLSETAQHAYSLVLFITEYIGTALWLIFVMNQEILNTEVWLINMDNKAIKK